MAPGLPLPGQTDITSGAVPEASWVRICCWYWSAPLVVKLHLDAGVGRLERLDDVLDGALVDRGEGQRAWSRLPPEAALVPPLQAASRAVAVIAATRAGRLRVFMVSPAWKGQWSLTDGWTQRQVRRR